MTKKAFIIKKENVYHCQGEWVVQNGNSILRSIHQADFLMDVVIDGSAITKMDTAGAYFFRCLVKKLEKLKLSYQLLSLKAAHAKLIDLVSPLDLTCPKMYHRNRLASIGYYVANLGVEAKNYLKFLGMLCCEAAPILINPKKWRINALVGVIDATGLQALPIVALLSFMIGIVLSYQMSAQLRTYGANIFIVDLLGLSILREFGPLLTAIMVAGRTGSSFAAELGTMKMNQELDAINTMGVTSTELLLMPKILGLVIVLPLLTMWANIFGLLGGMVMANAMLNITWIDFLHRFQTIIPLKALVMGLAKAPVFALIISTIGCFQGMEVENSADSVGKKTTRSVVLGIFFIIILDALFSILFSWFKL